VVVVLAVAAGGLALGARPASAASSTVTAVGRFAYVDDLGRTIGIRNASIEMCNDDGITGCPTMTRGTTDANGFFSITGSGGDFFNDLPDPLVKVTATGPSGFVQPFSPTPVDYCFRSFTFNNAGNQTVNFGTVTPSTGFTCSLNTGGSARGQDGAWQLWNNVREGWEFMRGHTFRKPGAEVPSVRVIWPDPTEAGASYRTPLPLLDNGAIRVNAALAFNEPVIFHEYGHHIMRWFGESPTPNYNNGNCDTIRLFNLGGHCFWRSELPPVAWTEGWPSYLAEVLTTSLGKDQTASSVFGCDIVIPTICGTVESPPQPPPDPDLTNVEGMVAAVLWDLMDSAADNRDFDNSTDRLSLGFAALWDLYQDRDPDPFTAHNKVTSLDELWEAFAALRPAELNRVSEIYDENGITKPAADLAVTALSASTANAIPGQAIAVTDTTANIGAVRTGTGSATRFYLTQAPFGILVPVAARGIGDLPSGGGTSTSTVHVVIPSSTGPGQYFVIACADNDGATFESNESNNCLGSGLITVAQPSVSIGDAAAVSEGNAGLVAMTFPISLSQPAAGPVSVNYATSDGTAKAALGDYLPAASSVSFGVGDVTKSATVWVNGDLLDEPGNETVNVTLSNPAGATIGDGSAVGAIVDDDAPPSLRINDVQVTEGNSGTKNVTFRVSLSAVSGRDVKVNWKTVNGGAVAPSDFVAQNRQLTIPANTPSRTITVPVKGDVVREPNEAFTVKLSSPVNATIADSSGKATIVNDD
jgi:hypothetical protein